MHNSLTSLGTQNNQDLFSSLRIQEFKSNKEVKEPEFYLLILNTFNAEPKHAKDWIPLFYYDFEDEMDANDGKGGHSYKLWGEIRGLCHKIWIKNTKYFIKWQLMDSLHPDMKNHLQ